ncbi:hypothetical protein PUN28_012311 [Cardiocondyla obscurior]|uniref:Uncharacterized protein n=1 Tax=Cardiocondyla obscurior TaxID=286306 RepID=A0AAW2FGB0_9HYME
MSINNFYYKQRTSWRTYSMNSKLRLTGDRRVTRASRLVSPNHGHVVMPFRHGPARIAPSVITWSVSILFVFLSRFLGLATVRRDMRKANFVQLKISFDS